VKTTVVVKNGVGPVATRRQQQRQSKAKTQTSNDEGNEIMVLRAMQENK